MIEKLKIHLLDSLRIPGDIIDFRIYDGMVFSEMSNAISHTDKKIYGLDTFSGLNEPNDIDKKHPNFNEIKKGQYTCQEIASRNLVSRYSTNKNYVIKNIKDGLDNLSDSYCFALIDLKQYEPTKNALNYVWDHINYGGTIFVSNFEESSNHSQHAAIKEFVNGHINEISISRQMMVNGIKERFIAIKCYNDQFKPVDYHKFHIKEKISIAMVLKTGGDTYNAKYVNALAKAIKDNVTVPHEIVCLTDDSTGFSDDIDKVKPLKHYFPKWWGKIELFNPENFSTDRVFYLDLDTVIIDDIDDIVSYDGDFAGLRDFYALHSLGSGLMGWNKHKVQNIYDNFLLKSRDIISNYAGGDQVWIDENKPSIEYFQDIYHNQIVSFKRHCMFGNKIDIPDKAKIICFHGNPRPHTVTHPLIKRYW